MSEMNWVYLVGYLDHSNPPRLMGVRICGEGALHLTRGIGDRLVDIIKAPAGPCSSAVDNLLRVLRDPFYQWVIPLLSPEAQENYKSLWEKDTIEECAYCGTLPPGIRS